MNMWQWRRNRRGGSNHKALIVLVVRNRKRNPAGHEDKDKQDELDTTMLEEALS